MRVLMQGLRYVVTTLTAATLGVSGLGVGAASAAQPEGTVRGADSPGTIRNRYIVVFKDGSVAAGRVASAATRYAERVGGTVQESYGTVLRGFSARLSEQAARRLAADPAVAFVEQDRTVGIAETQTPATWGLDRIDQRALPLSRSYTYTASAGVTAYILDTGIRTTHTEFGRRARSGYDFVDRDTDAADCNGHGTHVAGTIGGATYGVAKSVQLVGVRVLNCEGIGSYSQIIAGINWVTANATRPAVVNMSLGGTASGSLDLAVQQSTAAGITYAVSAGNSSADACYTSPARVPEAITVGATTSTDARASFSNLGPCLDVFAPGVGVTSAWAASDTATLVGSGTSMAAPHVAGAAALLLQGNPALTPAQVSTLITGAATVNVVTQAGAGSPNRLLYTGGSTPQTCPKATSKTNVPIPNRGTVTGLIRIAGCTGNASGASTVSVTVVVHRRGDVALNLISPTGVVRQLKAADAGERAPNVMATYTADLSASPRNGTWTLQIVSTSAERTRTVGMLNTWSITV